MDFLWGDQFPLLFGRWTDNKNDVVQNVEWEFTGKRNERCVFLSLLVSSRCGLKAD